MPADPFTVVAIIHLRNTMSQPNIESGFDDPSLPQASVASGNPDPGLYVGLSSSAASEGAALTPAEHVTKAIRALDEYPQNEDPNYHDALRHLRAAAESLEQFFNPANQS